MSKFYAVRCGKEGPKIYHNWNDCHKNVSGFSGAVYKSFKILEEAQNYICFIKNEKTKLQNSSINNQCKNILNKDLMNISETKVLSAQANTFFNFLGLTESQIQSIQKKILTLNKIIVFTDGSCKDQGTDTAKAGSGIYFPDLDVEIAIPVPGKQTNNRGELYAVIFALQFVWNLINIQNKNKNKSNNNNIPVEIHLDSAYVMKITLSKDKNNNSKIKANLELWKNLQILMKEIAVTWVKELAHSGIKGNEIADKLAKSVAFS